MVTVSLEVIVVAAVKVMVVEEVEAAVVADVAKVLVIVNEAVTVVAASVRMLQMAIVRADLQPEKSGNIKINNSQLGKGQGENLCPFFMDLIRGLGIGVVNTLLV